MVRLSRFCYFLNKKEFQSFLWSLFLDLAYLSVDTLTAVTWAIPVVTTESLISFRSHGNGWEGPSPPSTSIQAATAIPLCCCLKAVPAGVDVTPEASDTYAPPVLATDY